MKTRWNMVFLSCLLFAGSASAAGVPDVEIRTNSPGAVVTVERIIEEGKALLSVRDAADIPLLGLGSGDFVVTAGERTARIVSAQPVAESLDVPRNIILVLDNSFSMLERRAVGPLLAGVDELLKIVRPIDTVQVVVFSDGNTVNMGGRDLHVNTFKSSQPDELRNFIAGVYRNQTTSTTVLYEGMLAGLALIGDLPEGEPKFMVVFSDGEDLNSSYWRKDVLHAAEGLGRFNAYAIDYMPGTAKDKFLTEFAEGNRGEIWKATSETTLVQVFQSVASRLQYYYVVSYLFPITGRLGVVPAGVTIDEVAAFDASEISEPPGEGAPATRASVVSRIDSTTLTLWPVVDTPYGIARWKATLSNANGILAEQAGEGAPAAEMPLSFTAADLGRLAAAGDITVTLELEDIKGQSLVLAAPPVTVTLTRTTGSLAVVPASLTIDEVEAFHSSAVPGPATAASMVSRIDSSALTLRPVVDAAYGVARWKASVTNTDGTLAVLAGEGAPPGEIQVPLRMDDLGRVAAGGDIRVHMEVQDRKGQNLVLTAPPVRVNRVRTTGSLAVAPASLTIEEVRTIDASPMLGHIYFPENSSDLPTRYVRLADPSEAMGFDEHRFRDTMEKYYQVLNILGRRLADRPLATITLTGCNANTGTEKGNQKLSNARAEAVRDYLQGIWNVIPERMRIETRNLPEMPSTSRLEEGRSDNRRVEISTEDPSILGLIRSTYVATRIDTSVLTLRPLVDAPHGVARWTAVVANSREKLGELAGEGPPPEALNVPLRTGNLSDMAIGGDVKVTMTVRDNKGQELVMTAGPVTVYFVQTSQRLARKEELRVQEKYALILFDFDSDAIDARNQEIVNSIVARIRELPEASVDIVGHTDNIGKENYNVKLSERRALAVYKLLTAAYGEDLGERIRYRGVGPSDPLYDNGSPEARAFNRTVTITLEYMAEE